MRKPKSWLKSVSAFANGIGGTLFFGIDNDRNLVGLADAQADAEIISRLIKERITPFPSFILTPEREDGRDLLILTVYTGRNPVLADIFSRLGFMERQGSGFKKITDAYYCAHNFREELEPKFYSDISSFRVTLYNLNYNIPVKEAGKQVVDTPKTVHWTKKQSVEQSIHGLIASNSTKDKLFRLFKEFEFDEPFSRADIVEMFGITTTPANELLRKLKNAKLIESVKGMGKGKYKFIEPQE